jgi:hypothetical protein
MRGHILDTSIYYFAVDVPTWYKPSFTRWNYYNFSNLRLSSAEPVIRALTTPLYFRFLHCIFDKRFKKRTSDYISFPHETYFASLLQMNTLCSAWNIITRSDLLYMRYSTQTGTFPMLTAQRNDATLCAFALSERACISLCSGNRFKDNGMSVEHWWIDTGRVKSKYSEKETCLIVTFHHKSYMYWTANQLEPPGLKAGACAPNHSRGRCKNIKLFMCTIPFLLLIPWNKLYANRYV